MARIVARPPSRVITAGATGGGGPSMTTSESNRVPSGTGAGVPAATCAPPGGSSTDCAQTGAVHRTSAASVARAVIAFMNGVDPRTLRRRTDGGRHGAGRIR